MMIDRRCVYWISVLLVGLLAGSSMVAAAQEVGKDSPRPRAVVVDPIHDLGERAYGSETTHVFVVRNEGNAPLSIHKVESTCACTASDFDAEIAPGGEGEIELTFRAETQPGPMAVQVGVITNDPDSPRLELTLKADVRYHVSARPGFVRYIVYQGFESDSRVVQHLWAADGKPMRITGVETPYDFVSASFHEAASDERLDDVAAEQQWIVETRIDPDAPIGPLAGFLTIHTDHPRQKLVELPLHGFVRPMFAVTPPTLDLGRLEGGKAYQRSLHVKNFASEKIEVTGAETTVEGIEVVEVVEDDPGRIYWLRLVIGPEVSEGELSGKVRIKTASPKKPLLEVPIQGTVTAPEA